MPALKNIIVLVIALLLSQTAVAVHDVHGLDTEHDQSCKVYFTQDHSASSNTSHNQIEPIVYSIKPDCFITFVSSSGFKHLYLTRAPPYLHF